MAARRWAWLAPDSASASKALTPRPSHTTRTSTCWVQCRAVVPASSMEAVRAAAPKGPGVRAQARKCPRKVPGCGPRKMPRLGPVARHACWTAMTRAPDSSRPGLARRSVRVPGAGARGPPVPRGGPARAAAVLRSTYAPHAWRWAPVCRRKSGPERMALTLGRERKRMMLESGTPVTRGCEPAWVMSLFERRPMAPGREPTRMKLMLERTPVTPEREPKGVTSALERVSMMSAWEPKPAMLPPERARRRLALELVGVLAPRPHVPSALSSAGPVGYPRWQARRRAYLWHLSPWGAEAL